MGDTLVRMQVRSFGGFSAETSVRFPPIADVRRTKVAMLYRKTGNLRACQLLLGHTKLASTVRYLGVELDDALALSEALEI